MFTDYRSRTALLASVVITGQSLYMGNASVGGFGPHNFVLQAFILAAVKQRIKGFITIIFVIFPQPL